MRRCLSLIAAPPGSRKFGEVLLRMASMDRFASSGSTLTVRGPEQQNVSSWLTFRRFKQPTSWS